MRLVPGTWMNSFMDEALKDPMLNRRSEIPAVMKTDIHEKEDAYLLEIELPGFNKEDLKIELEDGTLTISAVRSEHHEEKDSHGTLIRQERMSGSCSRSYYLGEDFRPEDISARYDNGELKVTIRKKAPEPPAKKSILID